MTDHRFSKVGAGNHTNSLSAIQTSGIAKMSGLRHVHKIPTIRGTDIIRDPRLNKVLYVELIFQRQLRGRPYALGRTSFLLVRLSLSFVAHAQCDVERLSHILFCTTVAFCDMKNNAFTPCIEKDVFVFCSGINLFGTASWFILVCLFYVIPGVVGRPINF